MKESLGETKEVSERCPAGNAKVFMEAKDVFLAEIRELIDAGWDVLKPAECRVDDEEKHFDFSATMTRVPPSKTKQDSWRDRPPLF